MYAIPKAVSHVAVTALNNHCGTADWFEKNIVDPSTTAEFVKKMQEENPELYNEFKGDHEKSENRFFRVD